jgi:hypothetical protein
MDLMGLSDDLDGGTSTPDERGSKYPSVATASV